MPARFATLEARLNRAVGRHLPNAEAVFNGGEPFGVLFDRLPVETLEAVASYVPRVSFDMALAPGLKHQSVLIIDGERFKVVSGVEPDHSGWVTLDLRED